MYLGIGNNFAARSDEGGVKIEDDVDEEDDVDDGVGDEEADVFGRLILEGHVEGHHDGRVEGQEEDDVVPERLEGAVMQQDVRRRLGRLLAVLRHHIGVQAHHLPCIHSDTASIHPQSHAFIVCNRFLVFLFVNSTSLSRLQMSLAFYLPSFSLNFGFVAIIVGSISIDSFDSCCGCVWSIINSIWNVGYSAAGVCRCRNYVMKMTKKSPKNDSKMTQQ